MFLNYVKYVEILLIKESICCDKAKQYSFTSLS